MWSDRARFVNSLAATRTTGLIVAFLCTWSWLSLLPLPNDVYGYAHAYALGRGAARH